MICSELSIKSRLLKHLFAKTKKSMVTLEKKPANSNRLREFICFAVKTIEDCFRKVPTTDELGALIVEHRQSLVQTVCQTAENDDPMIQSQAQQLFTLVL